MTPFPGRRDRRPRGSERRRNREEKIEISFNYIWHVPEPRSFVTRFSSYLSVLLVGPPQQGKTNLLEAIAHLAGTSLRGATTDAMVRTGARQRTRSSSAMTGK